MYNRILKRPMFKRGGSSFQAQGTGITSPYDTPRKNYKVGTTWEEIEERRSNIYQPRTEMSFAAEGFSELGNPYRDDGSAKTIGEMLYAGATGVRKSRAADKALGQSVDLANIESDAARLSLEEERAWKAEQNILDRKSREAVSANNPLLKDKSISRQISELTENIIKIASTNRGNPGSEFELAGYAQGIAQGLVTINNMQGGDEIVTAMVVPSSAFKKEGGTWAFDVAQLAANMVYWDPTSLKWFVVENAQTSTANPIYFDSYEQAKGGLTVKKSEENKSKKIVDDPDLSEREKKGETIKLKITTNLKGVELTDAVVFDEAAKVGIKIVSPDGTKTWAMNLAENEMSLPAFKKILEKKKMSDTYAHVKGKTFRNKGNNVFDEREKIQLTEDITKKFYNTGGIVEPDPDGDELNELASWWKAEVNKSFDS